MRVIFHIDLDYFYAQIEERDNPSICDKPVLVTVLSGRGEDRGVIATANYIARSLGVKSGIPIAQAKKILEKENAVFIPMRRSYYRFISEEIMKILRDNSDVFEQASIDEAYLDVTKKTKGDFEKAYQLAHKIQTEIFKKIRLTLSIGIGVNKLIAKIASGINKPNGITIVRPEEITEFLNPLPIKKIPGIGEKTEETLATIGVRKIGDLVKLSLNELTNLFGRKTAELIYNSCRGIDKSPVVEKGPPSQKSRIKTLKKDTRDVDELIKNLVPLIEKIDIYLQKHRLKFRTVSVIFVTTDIKTHTKSKTLKKACEKLVNIQPEIRELITEFLQECSLMVRRIGIRAGNFIDLKNKGQTKLSGFLEYNI
ncbi:MAG: DNA polymerase IV [Candidatus Odinarchaeia archaeon]